MFALPGLLGLLLTILARPFEFVPSLSGLPLLYVFFAMALFGYLVDLRLGRTSARTTPLLGWGLGFLGWSFVTLAVAAPGRLLEDGLRVAVAVSLLVLISQSVQTLKVFEWVVGVVLACCIAVAAVCVHQGVQPFQCVAFAPAEERKALGKPDGRPCETPEQCVIDPPEPTAVYHCERVGLLGTTSVGHGRVRYVGVLQDPNEVALLVSLGIPLAFAFYQRRRSLARTWLLGVMISLAAITVVMSESRGGQLVFGMVLGAYFIRRYRWKGALVAALAAAPILLLGGRSGVEATGSSNERMECISVGLALLRGSPLLGVGLGQFTQYHYLTAHNSFVLAPAELGLPGMLAWTMLLWLSLKIPLRALQLDSPEAATVRTWAMALVAVVCGLSVGVFFLSFNYHFVFWVVLGLSGALHACVQRHLPSWRVHVGWRDVLGVAAVHGLLLALLLLTVRMSGM